MSNKIDITMEEKREIDNLSQRDTINKLDIISEGISEIVEERKYDTHLNELKAQVKELNADYKERIDMAKAKVSYLIGHLKQLNQ